MKSNHFSDMYLHSRFACSWTSHKWNHTLCRTLTWLAIFSSKYAHEANLTKHVITWTFLHLICWIFLKNKLAYKAGQRSCKRQHHLINCFTPQGTVSQVTFTWSPFTWYSTNTCGVENNVQVLECQRDFCFFCAQRWYFYSPVPKSACSQQTPKVNF